MRPDLPLDFLRLPIAHRALHDRALARVENSPSAVLAAVAAGYAIEVDVQLARDGVAIVFHDEDLHRLTGQTGLVADKTAEELGQIPLTGGQDRIPTLAQILPLVAGKVPLLIELKDQTGQMGRSDAQLERAVAAAMAGYNGPVAVMSFNPHSVAQMAQIAPNVPRGLTTSAYDLADWSPLPVEICNHLRDIPDFDNAKCSFISHEAADLARPRVAQLRAQGAAVLCWTIRTPAAEALARRHAQNITFEGYLPQIAP